MQIDILTLFPEICRAPLSESMMKRAQENKIVDLRIHKSARLDDRQTPHRRRRAVRRRAGDGDETETNFCRGGRTENSKVENHSDVADTILNSSASRHGQRATLEIVE